MHENTWLRRKNFAPRRRTRLEVELLENRTLPSVDVLASFTGLALDPIDPAAPPDTDIAVGPKHVVEVTNDQIAYYRKSDGDKVFEADMTFEFFAPLHLTSFHFDPNVSYDELAGRFIVTATVRNRVELTSFLLLAVSDDADPRGAWEMHAIDVDHDNQNWCDFPQMGWDADGIYVSCRMGTFQSGNIHIHLVTIDKATVLDNDPATLTYYEVDRPHPNETMQPAVMHGAAPGAAMYFVANDNVNANDALQVIRMTNKLSATPTLTEFKIPVPHYGFPKGAVQPDGEEIHTGFSQPLNAAWRGDRLVMAHTIGADGQKLVQARWYEFSTSGVSPTLVQSGEIAPGPSVFTYYPAIDIAPDGDLGMSFIQSSATEFMSIYVTGRKSTDPAGTMQTPGAGQRGRGDLSHHSVQRRRTEGTAAGRRLQRHQRRSRQWDLLGRQSVRHVRRPCSRPSLRQLGHLDRQLLDHEFRVASQSVCGSDRERSHRLVRRDLGIARA